MQPREREQSKLNMNDDDILLLENMDEEHWYGKNRNTLLYDLVAKHVKLDQKILEIGCGTGTILKDLSIKGFSVTGIEPTTTGFNACIEKNLNVQKNFWVSTILKINSM